MPDKWRERFYLDRFIESAEWTVSQISETEAPDFLVVRDGRPLGVEVTAAFRDTSDHGSESFTAEGKRARYVRSLVAPYYARGGPPLDASFWFHRPETLPDPSTIVGILLDNVPERPWDQAECELLHRDSPDVTIWLRRLPDEADRWVRWETRNDRTAWARRVDATFFEPTVIEKARLLPSYRLAAPEIVLVIMIDGMHASGFVHLELEPKTLAHGHGFDEVYVYKHPDGSKRLA